MSNKAMLIIMDGWGLGKEKKSDAIQNANVPFVNSLFRAYPNSTLIPMGEDVGLPDGQMGNSEVGHLNLGAGRIVYQELLRINRAIASHDLDNNPVLMESIQYAQKNNRAFHLLGLVSAGGVHSHIDHIKALVAILKKAGLKKVYIHAFTDGRDCDPKSGLSFLRDLQDYLDKNVGTIATVVGRYYGMDRDKRWNRVRVAYDAMVKGIGEESQDLLQTVQASYEAGITDEFIKPIINAKVSEEGRIRSGDVALCFNYRTDRCREITVALTQKAFAEESMEPLDLFYSTMTEYDSSFKKVHVLFENSNLNNTLGEVLSRNGKKQIRIAETEKYPHVTFFFNGGREEPFEGESRIMVPSPKVATYDLQPEMSADSLVEKLLPEIEKESADFICLNFANADMVGHTGIFPAVVKAVETVDHCVSQVAQAALKHGYQIILTADHGNADYLLNEDGTPNTQHSMNLVPYFLLSRDKSWKVKPGKLADVAPTLLTLMELPVPADMTGNVLISR